MYLEYFGGAFYIYWLIILFSHVWIDINIFYSFEDYKSIDFMPIFSFILSTLKIVWENFLEDIQGVWTIKHKIIVL